MECQKCHKEIGTVRDGIPQVAAPYRQAYRVTAGYVEESGDFEPEEDVGYYCSDCLADGV